MKTKRFVWLLVAMAILAAGAYSTYRYMRWRHDDDIDARIARLAPIIWKYAQANSLPTELVREMIRAESGGNERAESPKGAKGVMQITPVALAEVRRVRHIGGGDLFDPDYNIAVGTAYLRMMLDKFDGDAYLAVAAYNMGPSKLLAARRANPGMSGREIVEKTAPAATISYCRKVLREGDLRLPKAR